VTPKKRETTPRPLILKFDIFLKHFQQNKVFFRGENEISPLLVLPWKNRFDYLWKIHYWPRPGKNSSDAHAHQFLLEILTKLVCAYLAEYLYCMWKGLKAKKCKNYLKLVAVTFHSERRDL